MGDDRIKAYFDRIGLGYLAFAYSGEMELGEIFAHMQFHNPTTYYILGGASPVGNHSVVCLGNKIVHDPAGREPGEQIIGPMDDGFYWVNIIGASVAQV